MVLLPFFSNPILPHAGGYVKRKEKKKARITQLKTYKYEGILSIWGNRGRIEYLQERDRRSTRRS